MVRTWNSHVSSHSSDALIVAKFSAANDAGAAVEALESWISDPKSENDFESGLTYHEGKTVLSSVYSQDGGAVDRACEILRNNGAVKVEAAWEPVRVTVSVSGATMKEAESTVRSIGPPYAAVFDPNKYVCGETSWKETEDGRFELSTTGYLQDGEYTQRYHDETDERELEEMFGVKVSKLKELGCSIRAFFDVSRFVQRDRVSVYFAKSCNSKAEASAFFERVRSKVAGLFGLRPDSPELPDSVRFDGKDAGVTLGKMSNVSFEKKGHLIYNNGVFGDIYGGTAEAAESVSQELHCKLNLYYWGEARREFRSYEDGKLVRHVVPSDVDLMSPLAQQFQEVLKRLEAEGLVREADEARRLFLELAAKKRAEALRF